MPNSNDRWYGGSLGKPDQLGFRSAPLHQGMADWNQDGIFLGKMIATDIAW